MGQHIRFRSQHLFSISLPTFLYETLFWKTFTKGGRIWVRAEIDRKGKKEKERIDAMICKTENWDAKP